MPLPDDIKELAKKELLAICFHLGYPEMFSQFTRYIDNVINCGYETDIYITYQKDDLDKIAILKKYPDAIFLKSERGCDTGAFLLQMKAMYESKKNYTLIFKLHTKKDLRWRWELLNSIAGSSSIVKGVIDNFQLHQDIGMIGVKKWILCMDGRNKPIIDKICQKYGIIVKSHTFFIGGTIFWVRWSIYKQILEMYKLQLENEYLRCEFGYPRNEPSYTHSWERIFGILVYHMNLIIKGYPMINESKYLPTDFNWKSYLQINSDLKTLIIDHDEYINNISKICYGVLNEKLVDVTEVTRNYLNQSGLLNILTCPLSDFMGDPCPGHPKCLMIYCNGSSEPTKILSEYNNFIEHDPQKCKLYLQFNGDAIDGINEKIINNHYLQHGQFVKLAY